MIEIEDIKEDWWEKRVQFLVSRASAHREQRLDVLIHTVCAATLLRDAGCLLLLRDQFDAGRELLAEAGKQLLELGLGTGLALVAIHDSGRGRDELRLYRERVANVRGRDRDEKGDATERPGEPIALAARTSLGSMLSVVQAELLQGVGDAEGTFESDRRETERRELQERHGAREVGETGMSVFRYLRVAASLEASDRLTADRPAVDVLRAVELLGRRREERIEAARRDEFHWRLVPRPAELLDLDSVVLMQVALAAGYQEAALREWTGWERGDVVGAPLDVAAALRGSSAFGASV